MLIFSNCKRANARGVAIATILLAVVLLVALSVAIAISTRAMNADGNKEQMKQVAMVILNQAQIYSDGFHEMEANGIPIDTITFDNAANTGLWNPVVGGALHQVPLPRIGTVTPGFYWEYYGPSKAVQFPGIGTPAGAEYYLWTDYQKEEVCHQLNQILFNDPTIPTSTHTWQQWEAGLFDDTDDPATNGRPEGCFASSNNDSPWTPGVPVYFYYKTILEQ
jgi:hypothetical protein